ncbi:acyltransferase family protein [Rosistilla oblonga]|uniref:acyltransferase family protein n=1 Tax=Rosistilla oblonga TaxID=2527990 RepID=UPI003A97F6D1
MGILRLYLALCVVAAHSGELFPWSAHNGLQAVEIFFLISGFYMALIAPKYHTAREFYASRFIRIYIPYWTILAGIVLTCSVIGIATGKWFELSAFANYSAAANGVVGTCLATVTNFSAFGIDWLCFLTDEPNKGLQLASNGLNVAHPLPSYVAIKPAWSIGVELMFYVFVPWFNRRSTWSLFGLALLSVSARITAYELFGLAHDPWTYRFTPFAMALFLTGMIACRLTRQIEPKVVQFMEHFGPSLISGYPAQVVGFMAAFWIGLFLTEQIANTVPVHYADLVSYLGWAAIIPLLFAVTKSNKLDRWLGELSYPVYLVHYFIVSLIAATYTRAPWLPESARASIVAGISIAISTILLVWIVAPVERRRSRWAKAISTRWQSTAIESGELRDA